jgi:DtxR family Mn-dependent transcriptional regulator
MSFTGQFYGSIERLILEKNTSGMGIMEHEDDLIDTTEMYLRTILELEEEGQVPLRARIAERLNHAGPTVSQTVSRMERLGLVNVTADRHLVLTEQGRVEAVGVMRKHRLAERLLADIIGLEWQFVHEEACRWEHVMSERVERKILSLLKSTEVSPYGNPIPGLAALGADENTSFIEGVVSVSTLVGESDGKSYTLARIGEPLQVFPELLQDMKDAGLLPGAKLTLEFEPTMVKVVSASGSIELRRDFAAHLFVKA